MTAGLTALCLGILAAAPAPAPAADSGEVIIFSNGLRGGWQDFGWAPRDVLPGRPARIDFSNHGGWIIGGPEIQGRFAALVILMRTPARYGRFLAVHLAGRGLELPTIVVTREQTHIGQGTWRELRIPYAEINPDGAPFDTITLSAARMVSAGWVYIEKISLVSDSTAAPPLAPEPESTDPDADPFADMELEQPNIVGLALHAGLGVPTGGGSAMVSGGLSARLSFADAHLGVGLRVSMSYHSVEVQAGDAVGGTVIDVASQVVMLPILGVITLRLPFGDVAGYSHVGCGAAWVWASSKTEETEQSADTASWAVHGALGAEIALGPGWLGIEIGYLILPSLELSGVFMPYQGDGFTMSLHFRLGA